MSDLIDQFNEETKDGQAGTAVCLVSQKPDDTLRYKVSVSKAVAQDTVRVSSQVNVLVQPEEKSEKVMSERVLPALNDFIQGDWVISTLERRSDATGYERITMR